MLTPGTIVTVAGHTSAVPMYVVDDRPDLGATAVREGQTGPVRIYETARVRRVGPIKCHARQCNDQMMCKCGLAWDVNDPEPPVCRGCRMSYTPEQLAVLDPAAISKASQRHIQSVIEELIETAAAASTHHLTDDEECVIYEHASEDGWCCHDLSPDSLRKMFARVFEYRRARGAS